jgi:hypothetical protein
MNKALNGSDEDHRTGGVTDWKSAAEMFRGADRRICAETLVSGFGFSWPGVTSRGGSENRNMHRCTK